MAGSAKVRFATRAPYVVSLGIFRKALKEGFGAKDLTNQVTAPGRSSCSGKFVEPPQFAEFAFDYFSRRRDGHFRHDQNARRPLIGR